VLARLLADGGGDPLAVAAELGFEALGDDALAAAVAEVVVANPDEWAEYCSGDEKLQKQKGGWLAGQVMRATKGQADGKAVDEELRRLRAAQG